MQVHGDDVVCASDREHIGHKFRRNRSTTLKHKDMDVITGKETATFRFLPQAFHEKAKSQLIYNMVIKKMNNNLKLLNYFVNNNEENYMF